MTHKTYSKEEEEYIRSNVGKMTTRDMASHLNRPFLGVERKIERMGLSNNDREWSEKDTIFLREHKDWSIGVLSKKLNRSKDSIAQKKKREGLTDPPTPSLRDAILNILQGVELPILESSLLERIEALLGEKMELTSFRRELRYLIEEGYDIKEVISDFDRYYVLVRHGITRPEAYYRFLVDINTPLIITADWHLGSIGFSELALKEMIKQVEEYKIKDIVVAGDITQGRGVHRVELVDLKTPNIDDQIEDAVRVFNSFPQGTRFHLLLGGHEEKLKGNVRVGFDILRAIALRCPSVSYYGSVAKLRLNKNYSLLMIHGSGGTSYATSYKIEKVWRELVDKPDILVMGHLHQLAVIPKQFNKLLIMAGTLQRENAYLINKGYIPEVGWILLRDYNSETSDFKEVMPRVF